jgi:hypothetical protein
LLLATALAVVAGCNAQGTFQEYAGPNSTVVLRFGEKELNAEIAADRASRELGLMFRKPGELPRDHGMLFVDSNPRIMRFHMRNTEIPLSIAFLSDQGEILQIEDMKPKDETQTVSKNQGWFADNAVGVGSRIDGFEEIVGSLQG